MPYARRKLEAEQIVKNSNVPWSIVRATGFFWLLERMFANLVKQRILALPADIGMAPVDSDEFAQLVVECVAHGRPGEREDFAGPQTLPMTGLLEQYLAASGVQHRIRHVPLPKKIRVANHGRQYIALRPTRHYDLGAMVAPAIRSRASRVRDRRRMVAHLPDAKRQGNLEAELRRPSFIPLTATNAHSGHFSPNPGGEREVRELLPS